jgi:putative SOS response-associated peptidase YedK
MCGRFTLTQSGEAIAQLFNLAEVPQIEPRYNIAPTQPVLAVLANPDDPEERQFKYFYWGLIPSWAKDPSMGARLINARAETVAEKPAFRAAFKRRRCLIITDGFYEWQQLGKVKQPYYFYVTQSNTDAVPDGRRPFAFAGLWEHWESSEGDGIESCTILTTTSNALLRPIHERMPVILNEQDYNRWLDPNLQQSELLQPLLHPYAAEAMGSYPVNPKVNSPRYDTPECIQPLNE